ncbi:MAG TPA: hypothetical protein VJN63_10250 [Thermoplasmata archaeon]|nr:hypothetical protein [Thermoplasmata archaeon]
MDETDWNQIHRVIGIAMLLGGNRHWLPISFATIRMANDLPAFFDSMDRAA